MKCVKAHVRFVHDSGRLVFKLAEQKFYAQPPVEHVWHSDNNVSSRTEQPASVAKGDIWMKEVLKHVRKDDEIERPASLLRNARIQITQPNSFATLRCHLQFARTHCYPGHTPAHLAQSASVTPRSTTTI